MWSVYHSAAAEQDGVECVQAARDLGSLNSVIRQLARYLQQNTAPRGCPQEGTQGICTSIGTQQHVDNLFVSLTLLRSTYKSALPVTVFYWGTEVTADTQAFFRSRFGVEFVDLQPMRTTLPHKCHDQLTPRPGGFELKAHAVHHSLTRYQHVLWMDADNFLLSPPEALFASEEYVENGSFFWPDFFSGWVSPEIYTALTDGQHQPAERADTESGQLLLNMCMHQDVLEYVLALNEHSQVTYSFMFGDKDTFRLAFALAGKLEQFYQLATPPGAAFATVEGSSELQRLKAAAADQNGDHIDVATFAPQCLSSPALLTAMIHISSSGEPAFLHRTNAEFSLRNQDQIKTELILPPQSPAQARTLLWQVPFPSLAWAFCQDQETPYEVPRIIAKVEKVAEESLEELRALIGNGSFDSYLDMAISKPSEIVRAMQITATNTRRAVTNCTNGTNCTNTTNCTNGTNCTDTANLETEVVQQAIRMEGVSVQEFEDPDLRLAFKQTIAGAVGVESSDVEIVSVTATGRRQESSIVVTFQVEVSPAQQVALGITDSAELSSSISSTIRTLVSDTGSSGFSAVFESNAQAQGVTVTVSGTALVPPPAAPTDDGTCHGTWVCQTAGDCPNSLR